MVVKRECPHCKQSVILFRARAVKCPVCKCVMYIPHKDIKKNN